MAYLNKVFLIGNLTRNPELRITPKGTSICQFGLAVNRKFKGEDGSDREEVSFIDIDAWGKQGDLVAKYLQKGSPAFIEGRLRFDSWEDKQSGQKRSKLKVVMENVQFLGAPRDAGRHDENGTGNDAPVAGDETPVPRQQGTKPARPGGGTDDEVPF